MTEAELVRKCQKGSKQAQHALFETYADRFYRLMLRYVRTQEDAEDLIMVAFVKIYGHIDGFVLKDHGGLEAWMRKIMVNEALMFLPAGYRTVFNLFVIEGYDHGEIARLLGISENTSRSQLFKAKQLLKRKIGQEGMQYGT